MKFNDFAQTYKLHLQAHLKPRTIEQYADILRRILVPRFTLPGFGGWPEAWRPWVASECY